MQRGDSLSARRTLSKGRSGSSFFCAMSAPRLNGCLCFSKDMRSVKLGRGSRLVTPVTVRLLVNPATALSFASLPTDWPNERHP
jgi:hypothetical protein